MTNSENRIKATILIDLPELVISVSLSLSMLRDNPLYGSLCLSIRESRETGLGSFTAVPLSASLHTAGCPVLGSEGEPLTLVFCISIASTCRYSFQPIQRVRISAH